MVLSKRHIPTVGALPETGAASDEGYIVKAHSRGPGVAVEVANPLAAPPTRVSGSAAFRYSGGKLFLTPTSAPEGDEFAVTLEY